MINLAYRLQENCLVNGVLIDNITKTTISSKFPEFWESLIADNINLPTNKVKGQLFEMNCWQIKTYKPLNTQL